MPDANLETSNEMDFLKPEQRLNSIAEILSTIALRAANSSREEQAALIEAAPIDTKLRPAAKK